jgi:hypothetical protein
MAIWIWAAEDTGRVHPPVLRSRPPGHWHRHRTGARYMGPDLAPEPCEEAARWRVLKLDRRGTVARCPARGTGVPSPYAAPSRRHRTTSARCRQTRDGGTLPSVVDAVNIRRWCSADCWTASQ